MKYLLTKDEFATLPEEMQKEYTLDGDKATLKLEGEGAPDPKATAHYEEKLRIEREHRKNAEKARDAAETRSEKLREDLDKASGKDEIARIKADHQAELEKIRADREAEQKQAKESRNAAMIKETAQKFAADHFTIPGLIEDQIAKRLSVEEVDGQAVLRVRDADGKPSILSVSELQKEFLDKPEFAPIIKSKAGSGGGAIPGGGGGASQINSLADFKTGKEEVEFAKANPEAYERMVSAEQN